MPSIDNNGVAIHFEVEGDGPPLVIQHGFTDSSETWREQGYVDALKKDFQLLLIDERGHGRSGKPHDPEAYDMKHNAADIVAVLDELGHGPVHYFGYSWGSRIGFALAKYFPERVHSMVLGGCPPLTGFPPDPDPFMAVLEKGADAIADIWDAPVSPALRARIANSDVEALIAMRRVKDKQPDLDDVLPEMKMPCLVLAGEDDGHFQNMVQIVPKMPNVEFVTFPGFTHAGLLFRSDLMLPHVQAFLAAHA